jgi:hypothetical protein
LILFFASALVSYIVAPALQLKSTVAAKALGAARAITPRANENAERVYLRFISISLGECHSYCNPDAKDIEIYIQ